MMAGPLSKRQQARNERTLQELIRSVPGNNVCADCGARNPGWASWSLGIFLCMRCAGLHRKLGTHISKVKSLSMDSWANEQVENMKKIGNVASNRIYNPDNMKPPIPFDVDEADSAMERFMRQKYQHGTMQPGRAPAPDKHNTGSTESDDNPPPLPPKGGGKFGFRSASSIFPMSSKAKREAIARANFEAERVAQRSPTSPSRNKPSRVVGTAMISDRSSPMDLDNKLATLNQMGFTDEKYNIAVLKDVGGSVTKAVETLVKSGASAPASRARTPLSITAGITIQHSQEKESPRMSKNPFDLPSPLPIQSSQSTGNVPNQKAREIQRTHGNHQANPHPSNPFGLAPSQSQYSLHQQYLLDQTLQSLSVTGQSQPLFPNHTGGIPNNQSFQVAPPRMPTIPQNFSPAVFDAQSQPQQQQSTLQNQNHNPFLQQQTPPTQIFNQTLHQLPSTNPYILQQRAQTYPQALFDQSHAQHQAYYNPNQQAQIPQEQPPPQPFPQINNNPYGFAQQNQQAAQQQQSNFMQLQAQPLQLLPQQTGRADKSSILALYNYPQLAPQIPESETQAQPSQDQSPNGQGFPTTQTQPQQQRSVSSPLASFSATSRNPFMSNTPAGTSIGNGNIGNGMNSMNGAGGTQNRHVSQESMSIDVGGWHGQNGRHSPDAFANLSARSMR